MSIRIMKQNLQEAFKGLAKVVCGKTTLPILACVRLKSEDNTLTISGTDLEQWLDYRVQLPENSEPLDCIVRLEALKEFVNGGDGKSMLSFEMAGANFIKLSMEIAGQKIERLFEIMPLDDWPAGNPQAGDTVPVSKEIFNKIKLALPSASSDTSRKVLNGVLLEKDGITATDGKHIVRLKQDIPVTQQVIMPATKVLSSGMLKEDGGFSTTVKEKEITHVHFSSGNWCYAVRCVDGNYPNYNHVIPSDAGLKNRITFTAEDVAMLMKSLPLLDVVDTECGDVVLYAGSLGVKFMSRKSGSDVRLEPKAEYKGSHSELLACVKRDDIIHGFGLGFTELRFSDAYSPFVFKGESGLYEFMPMRNVPNMEIYYKKLKLNPKKEDEVKKKEMTGNVTVQPQAQVTADNKVQSVTTQPQTNVVTPAQTTVTAPQANAEAAAPQTEHKPGLTMIATDSDPFDELLRSADDLRLKVRDTFESVSAFQKKIRDAQKSVKFREKNYRNTRELMEKFKTAVNF